MKTKTRVKAGARQVFKQGNDTIVRKSRGFCGPLAA